MAQRKQKEFIANEANIDIMDKIVAKLNEVADTIRDMYDKNELFRELFSIHRMTARGFEPIPEHNRDFAFTMVFGVVQSKSRRKPLEYRVRVNTYTNDITCIDKDSNEFSMPLLTDALSVIKEKVIEVAFS